MKIRKVAKTSCLKRGSDLKHALSVVVINIILIMAFHVQDIRFLR